METILQYGLAGVVSYGFVGILTYFLKKRNILLDKEMKFMILLVVALLVGFIPADLGSVILNHLKTAIGVALSLSTISTLANKAGGTD